MTAEPDPWDAAAERFDDEPDHGLRDENVRVAWLTLLRRYLPAPGASVADLGCGTGSLSCLLAADGFAVTGVDLSRRMLELARQKAAVGGVSAAFVRGDAADPPLRAASVDVVLVRHLLLALPDADAAVRTWAGLLRAGGGLVLVEGQWHTGGGLHSGEVRDVVRRHLPSVDVVVLDDPALWGGPTTDERYLVTAHR